MKFATMQNSIQLSTRFVKQVSHYVWSSTSLSYVTLCQLCCEYSHQCM